MTYKLPKGWIIENLGNIAFINMGQSPPSSSYNYEQIGLPFYQGKSEFGDIYPIAEKYCSEPIKIVDYDDVLISVRAPIGPTNLVKDKSCIGRGLAGIKAFGGMSGKFLLYQLRTKTEELQEKGTGTTFKSISKSILEHSIFKIPPLNEQERIVSKIESLFSELDQAEKGLEKAKQQLGVYKQALLKSAFEGKLTAEWRKDNNPESVEMILEQIENERREHYNQELDDWNAALLEWHKGNKKGRKPVKPRFPSFSKARNYKIDKVYGKLPDSWTYTVLSEISHYITDGDHQAPKKSEVGIPFITISNIENNIIDFENTFFVSDIYYDSLLDYRKPQKGDVLYTVTGSFGIPVLVDSGKKFCFQRHIGLIRPVSLTNSAWLFYLMQSKQISDQATISATGTAQKTVGLNSLRNFVVPFCSYKEQILIVEKLDSQLSIITKYDDVIKTSLLNCKVIRQSILKKAFEGKLVAQDSLSESANKLLKQIKAEKETYLKKLLDSKKNAPKKIKKMEKSLNIVEVLKSSDQPILAQKVWQESKYNENITAFYAELKELGDKVIETREGLDSFLSLKK